MSQEIKDYYEKEWINDSYDPTIEKRLVIYCDNVSSVMDNYIETIMYMKKVVREKSFYYPFVALVFPEETTFYFYEENEVEIQNESFEFKATAILFSFDCRGADCTLDNSFFHYYKNINNEDYLNSPNRSQRISFLNYKERSNVILSINIENFYEQIKNIKEKKIEKIKYSLYHLKHRNLELL